MGKGTIIGVGAKKKETETYTKEQLNNAVEKATKQALAELETTKNELAEAQKALAELEKKNVK